MRKHVGKRERAARMRQRRRGTSTIWRHATGWLTFKLGRKKFVELFVKNRSVEKFRGCVVDAER